MAAFATPDDLADYLGRDRYGDPTEYRQAVMLLNLASAEIRAWCRQTIDLVEDDDVVLAGSWSSGLRLPELPVVEVSSVAVNDVALAATGWALIGGGLVVSAGSGVSGDPPVWQGSSGLQAGHWGGPGSTVAVTYSHGFATIPLAVKSACLAIASRLVTPAAVGATAGGQVRSETIAGYSVTYANAGATAALSPVEMASLRYLRRTW